MTSELLVDAVFYGSLSHLTSSQYDSKEVLLRLISSINHVSPKRLLHNFYIYLTQYYWLGFFVHEENGEWRPYAEILDAITKRINKSNFFDKGMLRACLLMIDTFTLRTPNEDFKDLDFLTPGDGLWDECKEAMKELYYDNRTYRLTKKFRQIFYLSGTHHIDLDTAKFEEKYKELLFARWKRMIPKHPLYIIEVCTNYASLCSPIQQEQLGYIHRLACDFLAKRNRILSL